MIAGLLPIVASVVALFPGSASTMPPDTTTVRCGPVSVEDQGAALALIEYRISQLREKTGVVELVVATDTVDIVFENPLDVAVAEALCAPPRLTFHPVLEVVTPQPDETVPSAAPSVPTDPATSEAAVLLPGRDGANYVIGDGRVFGPVEASANLDFGEFAVTLAIPPDQGDAFVALSNVCYFTADLCPTGRLAIVLDGEVLTAPIVDELDPAAELTVTGSFTEAETTELADALNATSLTEMSLIEVLPG